MRNHYPWRLAVLALFLPFPALLSAGTVSVRYFDAATATPADLARAVDSIDTSAPGTLIRLEGLRGAGGEALTLDLEPAPVFDADFHLYVDGQDRGADAVARLKVLRGTVEEWPGSSVALTVDGVTGAWSGYLAAGGELYEVALPAGVTRGSIAGSAVVRRADAGSPARRFLSDAVEPPPAVRKELGRLRSEVVAAPGAEYEAKVAIDSDYELFQRFGSVGAAVESLTGLMGGVSELYFRQLGVSLKISSLSLNTRVNDPWRAPNPHGGAEAEVLCEFSSYWQKLRPLKKFPRNAALFFTGKDSDDIGGQAFLSGLCNYQAKPSACPFGGYGIIVLGRAMSFNLFIIAHELGHTFGSSHTHCYNPPIDRCLSGERGCYQGPESEPPDGGSVMSYCNPFNFSMGEPGRFGLDSQRVGQVIRGLVDTVGPGCLTRTNDPYALTGEAGRGSATLSWTNPFGTETSWLVEQRLPNGKFKQVRSLEASATEVTLTGLKRGPNAFRVRAKLAGDFSDYSSVVTVRVP